MHEASARQGETGSLVNELQVLIGRWGRAPGVFQKGQSGTERETKSQVELQPPSGVGPQ